MGQLRRAIILIAATIIVFVSPSAAKVVKFEVLKVESPAFEGRTFGAVGTYDRILARATIAVTPDDINNKIIVDLDRAPRDAQGQVEATTDVEILRPTVAANGNRTLFYEVLNRGSKLGFALFNDLPAVTALKSDEMPPSKGAAYPVFVPKTDADGRDVAGIHLPTLEAAAATHTGWNLRKAGFGEGELCDNNGTMIPFSATKEERLRNNDPRLSMEERYPNQGDRAAAIAKATRELIGDRLILQEDAGLFIANSN